MDYDIVRRITDPLRCHDDPAKWFRFLGKVVGIPRLRKRERLFDDDLDIPLSESDQKVVDCRTDIVPFKKRPHEHTV